MATLLRSRRGRRVFPNRGASAVPFRARLSSVRGPRGYTSRCGRITPYAVEALIDDALHLAGHGRLELRVGRELDQDDLAWLEGRLARLDARGVKVRLVVDRDARFVAVPADTAGPESWVVESPEPDDTSHGNVEPRATTPHAQTFSMRMMLDDRMRRRRVLLAEDDGDQRRLLAHVLRAHAFDVEEAADGVSLLKSVQAATWCESDGGYDVIVTDVNLPHLSGLEVLGALQCAPKHIPAIVVTAYGTDSVRSEASALGVRAVLDKPVDFGRLCAAVCEAAA
jgi:two-component system, cell cycle response regulator CpdR